jgi:predicted acylesterase/phospholipase RssA
MSSTEATAARPARLCDLVMKGGITSGVAYPLAAVELAKTFRFRNIGGTSVGAIAAAFTAAAEHARGKGEDGFARLAGLPEWFGDKAPDGRSNLVSLFEPEPETAPFFRVFLATLRGRRNRIGRAFNVLYAALGNFPLHAAAGAAPGLALLVFAGVAPDQALRWAAVAAALVMAGVGAVLGVGFGLWRIVTRGIAANMYGVCTGHAKTRPGAPPPLTDWIAETVDRYAGRDPAVDPPLTFGDLWGGSAPEADEHGVNLQMMTTNLTQGRPMRVPFEDPGRKGIGQYFFDPDEFRRLFPARLVDHMIAHAPARGDYTRQVYGRLVPLPLARDLPVAVGVRLSLSYPVLLAAIPLYTIDWTREGPRDSLQPERCWFSDGGLTSNFPVHFFDQPLPRWPTFAINLRPPHPDMPDETVWMPRGHRERGVAIWNRFDDGARPTLGGFLNAVKDVTQNWMDNEQARVPGYRDRVVHITLKRGEGGVNIDMPPAVVADMAERGRRAGALLAERYATGAAWDVAANWDNHRWVRYRTAMAGLEDTLRGLERNYEVRVGSDRTYRELVERPPGQPPFAYPWRSDGQRSHGIGATSAIMSLIASWRAAEQTFGQVGRDDPGLPEPRAEFRMVPRM